MAEKPVIREATLADAPHIARILARERTVNDHFVAYEGLGYIDPNLSPNLDALAAESRRQFDTYGYTIAGYLIAPPDFWLTPEAAAAYATFATDGMGLHPDGLFTPRIELNAGVPLVWASFFTEFNEQNADKVAGMIARNSRPGLDLLLIRGIQVRPSFICHVMDRLNKDGPAYQALAPRTFFALAADRAADTTATMEGDEP